LSDPNLLSLLNTLAPQPHGSSEREI
jgi:hypothetical protein